MKRFYGIWIAFFSVGVVCAQSDPISLEECYRWAKENYPLIRQYDLIRQSEEYTLDNASKGYLPQVAVNAKATYQNEVTKIPVSIQGLDVPTLSKDQYQVIAEVNQTIWDGGNIRSTKEVTKAKAEMDTRQVETQLYTLHDRINQLYFGILLHDALLNQNAILQTDLQVNIEKITSMMENGVANQSDLESMRVEWLNARQKEVELKSARQAYIQMLAVMTGKNLTENSILQLPGDVNPVTSEIRRPELQLYAAQDLLLDTQNKQITAGLMPRLGLFVQGGYGRPGLNMLDNDFSPFYVGGIRLSWNLGKLYTAKNDRRKLDTDRLSVNVQRATFLFNTRLQLTQQNTEIKKMSQLLETDNEIVTLRSSIRKSAEVKLENGIISVTDLIREINAEDQAKQTAVQHRIQRLQAIYNYKYVTNN
ncbi:TolC family protein [Parabacteroides pacaensis]|uniref:TolC family protein n=1 Tax=Parabacteroides pacaensis TaxID=2086575 RepID=UPI000D0FD748|nr:TolC family protein [Parabacteroides pacaensis]